MMASEATCKITYGDKPFQCKHCNKCFSQAESLTQHERTHTGLNPFLFECKECGKCFGDLWQRKRTHTGHKRLECDQCGKLFNKEETLTNHKRTHTGERPFVC